jgi:serine/threonine-protein kinase
MTQQTDRLNTALAGRYRIERHLGEGGMASVYLCEDLRHKRKVALKLLKPELAAVLGADRFVQEITTTASLQHPHILPLFDSGTADGFLFYVMPLVEGETLREKLSRETQLGVDEAVRIAREVLDALHYAHEHGIVHRDVKPENILLHGGHAMVADFGIALAVSAAAGGRMTETGLSLGTPHYMSPEQATAEKEITARSDVYSLGSVLYEMLTGEPPHMGNAAQQIIMKIITEPAKPVTVLRKSVPPNVTAAVAKSLEKLPADRFESARAFADALGNATFAVAGAASGWSGAHDPNAFRYRRLAFGSTAVVAVTLAALVWTLTHTALPVDDPVVRMTIDLPRGDRLYPSASQNIAITPLGDRVAFVAQNAAHVHTLIRRTSESVSREATATISNDLAFSPDGRWLAYIDLNEIRKISVDGGAPLKVAALSSRTTRGLVWLSKDTILFGTLSGLFSAPSAGGVLRPVPGFATDSSCMGPVVLSDGKSIACATSAGTSARRIMVRSRASGKATLLDVFAAGALGMRDGQLIYVTVTGALMAVPFDVAKQRVTGDAVEIESGVLLSQNSGVPVASLSADGSLAYVAGESTRRLVLATPGRPDVELVRGAPRSFRYPRLSPDGKKVAVTVNGAEGSDIWVIDRTGNTFNRVTFDGNDQIPEWSPDGAKILFRHGANEVWWLPADGSTKPELLYAADENVNEAIMSPDGKWLVYRTGPNAVHVRDIFAVPLSGDRKPVLIVGGPAQESHPRISPDGRWIAYQSDETERFEVYVRPFPGPGSRTVVSSDGGSEPVWSRSGQMLYYRSPAGLMSVPVTTGARFTIGERRASQAGETFDDGTHAGYDVAADGQLLMLRPTGTEVTAMLVHNWGRVLREKLGLVKK